MVIRIYHYRHWRKKRLNAIAASTEQFLIFHNYGTTFMFKTCWCYRLAKEASTQKLPFQLHFPLVEIPICDHLSYGSCCLLTQGHFQLEH
jgi:hypothetical protein